MTTITKLAAVQTVLAKNKEAADWYADQHSITAEKFTAANVRIYGGDGLGDMADMIISDGAKELAGLDIE